MGFVVMKKIFTIFAYIAGFLVIFLGILYLVYPKSAKTYRLPDFRYDTELFYIQRDFYAPGSDAYKEYLCYNGSLNDDITIPEGITDLSDVKIGSDMEYSKGIYINLPKSIKKIENVSWLSNENIIYITVDEDNPYFKSVNGILYTKKGNKLIMYPFGKGTEFEKG